MAGDWLKVEKDTPRKPEILAIAAQLKIHPDEVFGKCFRLWSWADSQTADGAIRGVTVGLLDDMAGLPGFAQAMLHVGWLLQRSGFLEFPRFDRHMGENAKRRAMTAKRVARHTNANTNGSSVSSPLPEKRREENTSLPAYAGKKEANGREDATGTKAKPERQPRPRDELFDAVCQVTASDPKTSGSHVGRVCKQLREADVPYTPAEVFSLPDLLSQRGFTLPLTLGSVTKYIGQVRTWKSQAEKPWTPE